MSGNPRRSTGVMDSAREEADRALLLDLMAVLQASPSGLRRWSVMRAMRARRAAAGQEITLKFEDEVERVFRRNCEAPSMTSSTERVSEDWLFYRPKDKAGEVWALDRERFAARVDGDPVS